MKYAVASLTIAFLASPLIGTPKPKQARPSALRVESLMTASEFQASGLSKLTSSELAALNRWVNSFAVSLLSTTNGSSGEVIESEIDGEFEGWSGETIFKLANGQIWQQAEYDYEYEYEYRPKVMIYRSGGEYRLKVEGMDQSVAVKRLK